MSSVQHPAGWQDDAGGTGGERLVQGALGEARAPLLSWRGSCCFLGPRSPEQGSASQNCPSGTLGAPSPSCSSSESKGELQRHFWDAQLLKGLSEG
jgi:hypothetical protein